MLYHFLFELSDVDRGTYAKLNFRINQHPSEVGAYLLTRALAYALNYQSNLEFSPNGLGDPEAPALFALSPSGSIELWIEIGNPSVKKMHKASKAADKVVVYTYKSADLLMKEISNNEIYRGREIQVFAFDPKFLQTLEEHLKKNNRWSVLRQQNQLDIHILEQTFSTEVVKWS